MLSQKFKVILFDLDGTLVNSAPDIAHAMDILLVGKGFPPAGLDRVITWVGNGARVLVERALQYAHASSTVSPGDVESTMQQYLAIYAEHNGDNTVVYTGVREGLGMLEKSGIMMACITNKPEHLAHALLQRLGLDHYFPLTIGGDTFPVRKPEPTALIHAAQHFAVGIEDCLMVGDSPTDIGAARACGMPVVCVDYGYNHDPGFSKQKPDWIISDLRELAHITG